MYIGKNKTGEGWKGKRATFLEQQISLYTLCDTMEMLRLEVMTIVNVIFHRSGTDYL